jgi:hypothetical protein
MNALRIWECMKLETGRNPFNELMRFMLYMLHYGCVKRRFDWIKDYNGMLE